VWWCPTGLLAFLPLHAAAGGHPLAGPGAMVMDRVVSSYTFTVRELTASPPTRPISAPTVLAVALPHTPDAPALPGTQREIDAVTASAPVACLLVDGQASRQRILAELPRHPWFHFAGHGRQALDDPDRAGLLPYDHVHGGLVTIDDIGRLHLRHAELAFLNACETALGREHLADESLHLAAALRAVGFSHVVASMWPVDDDVAAEVAAGFYRRLAGRTADDAAMALHETIRAARTSPAGSRRRHPWLWAQFIHTGR
jgi:CHAT domain-containing protein